jgi:hypothetical protein
VIVAGFVLDGHGEEWRVWRDGLGVGLEPLSCFIDLSHGLVGMRGSLVLVWAKPARIDILGLQ